MSDLLAFSKVLASSNRIVGFTGAGVSTAAGISDYRSQGGIWEKFTPVSLAQFINDPEARVLYWRRKKTLWESIVKAEPTAAHYFFVDLQRQGRLLGLITQNIDGLHEKSGLPAETIVNLHGTTLEITCLDCGDTAAAAPVMAALDPAEPPRCRGCGGLLKPNTISFGQQLVEADLVRAEKMARRCDLMIAFGSTLQVQPAATFPLLAKEAGATLAIVTLSDTPLDPYGDFVFHESLSDFLAALPKP